MSIFTDSLFNAFMYPIEKAHLTSRRKELIDTASGDVLETGAGTGINLRFYNPGRIQSLTLTDLMMNSPMLVRKAARYSASCGHRVELRASDLENLPFPDSAFDTVVATLVFCSVENPGRAIAEVRRVLRNGGSFLFIEHILSPEPFLGQLMRYVTPFWSRIMGGCRLDRETETLIGASGFRIEHMERYARGIFITGRAVKET